MIQRSPSPADRFPGAALGAGRPLRGLFVGRSSALLDPRSKVAGTAQRGLPRAVCSPMVLRLLFRAAQRGWKVYLIGNEEAVARGRVGDAAWERFEADLLARLHAQGIPIVRHYACLDHPKGKGRHRRDSVFRFPNTGALFHAAQEDGIELRESWVVAAEVEELAAGWRAGCRVARIGAPKARSAGASPARSTREAGGARRGAADPGAPRTSAERPLHENGAAGAAASREGVLEVETDFFAADLAGALAQLLASDERA